MRSQVAVGTRVDFPEWRGERHYMLPFTLRSGLPKEARRYQNVVDQMMGSIQVDRDQECYFMVDEKDVVPGQTHRRPGLHVEGYWIQDIRCHGGGGTHSPLGYHAPTPGHSPSPPQEPEKKEKKEKKKVQSMFEAVLLASSHTAARALIGDYTRDFVADWRGGDCAELDTTGLDEMILQGGLSYNMDVFTLHESLPVQAQMKRTVIRINARGAKF